MIVEYNPLHSGHLRLLAEAGLLTPERQGDALWCRRSDLHLMELVGLNAEHAPLPTAASGCSPPPVW